MASILGLTSTNTFESPNNFYSLNDRRRVFRAFPTGAAPLTGLLSLMENEATDNPEFGWFEKRYEEITATLDSVTTTTPFSTDKTNPIGGSVTPAANSTLYICLDTVTGLRISQQILIRSVKTGTGSTTFDAQGVITEVGITLVNGKPGIGIRVLELFPAVIYVSGTNNTGLTLKVIGTANDEGAASSGGGRLVKPINVSNYTQIFRTRFSFTRTALKVPAVFDKTGLYREKAKDNCLDHMVQMEYAFLFGVKQIVTNTNIDGDSVMQRTTGGLTYFLKEYQKLNSVYRGGSCAAQTANTDDGCRIVNEDGSATFTEFMAYMEKLFRRTSNKAREKLCLCGTQHLMAINKLVDAKVALNKDLPPENVYGMDITTVKFPFGTIHFKTHPLFDEDSVLRKDGLYVDLQNLRYRYLTDSDTQLLKNRQNNDEDGRKDEWLTEAGLEVRFPESHMWIRNLTTLTDA